MVSWDILFTTLPLTIILGSPFYLLFRRHMGKPEKKIKFTNTKIIQFVILIFLIGMPIFLQFIGIFIAINKSNNPIPILAFILSLLAAFYGVGIYVSTLLLETFTVNKFSAFLHGTLSHILMHWGMFFAFISLVFLSDSYVPKLMFTQQTMIILWGIAGFFHALSQILNKTAYFQLIGGLLCLIIFFLIERGSINSIEAYFLSFFGIFTSTLFIYLFTKK